MGTQRIISLETPLRAGAIFRALSPSIRGGAAA